MKNDEQNWIGKVQPFGTAEAAEWESRLGRCHKLALALWGKGTDDLRRQLQKPHPDVPDGFDVADFQLLLRESSRIASMNLQDPRNAAS